MEANQLRRKGENKKADLKYDYLLKKEPKNTEYLFNKALNISNVDPIKSIEILKEVFLIDPNINGTAQNIVVIVKDNPKELVFEKAIKVFSELYKRNPYNLDLAYHRACLQANSGNHLNGLLEFYDIIDKSLFIDNPKQFEESPLPKDITFCLIHLQARTQFEENIVFPVPNENEIRKSKIKEYNYYLPLTNFENKNYFFDFGKYLGKSIKEIIIINPRYITWCIENINSFCVSEDILELIKRRGISTKTIKNINLFKLSLVRRKIGTIKNNSNKPLPESFRVDKNGNLID